MMPNRKTVERRAQDETNIDSLLNAMGNVQHLRHFKNKAATIDTYLQMPSGRGFAIYTGKDGGVEFYKACPSIRVDESIEWMVSD